MVTGAADASADSAPVGHRVENLVVPGSFAGENRKVRVHLWYPAAEAGFAAAPKTEYTSGLNGKPLYPDLWDPLGWKVEAEIARETGAMRSGRGAAAGGRVLARGVQRPDRLRLDAGADRRRRLHRGRAVSHEQHAGRRADRLHQQPGGQGPSRAPLFDCEDGRPSPCARNDAAGARSVQDRVRDVTYIIDALPGWFAGRADATRVGVMGHSRGTITALAAAGGSSLRGGSGPSRT